MTEVVINNKRMKAIIKDIKKGDDLVVTFQLLEGKEVVLERKVAYALDTEEDVIKEHLNNFLAKHKAKEARIDIDKERQELEDKAIKTVNNLTNLEVK